MSEIKAGVILRFEYGLPTGIESYSGYVDYEDKISGREDKSIAYSVYANFYMDNPDKTSGLFDADKDMLSPKEKMRYKDLYDMAQENGSPMWRPIISFDNRWLSMMGIYDAGTHTVNVKEIQTATRLCVKRMLENEKLEGTKWTAAIHHNTDNIHVHVSIVQPCPINDWSKNNPKFKLKSFNRGKSAVVNYMMENQKEFNKIRQISRKKILDKGYDTIIRDEKLKEKLETLYRDLPSDRRLWKYNMNAISSYRGRIDEITKIYLEKYCKDDYKILQGLLIIQQQKYELAYGGTNDYAENQIRDLYVRIGNQVLREGLNYKSGRKQEVNPGISIQIQDTVKEEIQSETKLEADPDVEFKVSEKSLEAFPIQDEKNMSSKNFLSVVNENIKMKRDFSEPLGKEQELDVKLSSKFLDTWVKGTFREFFKENKMARKEIFSLVDESEKVRNFHFMGTGINEENPLLMYTIGEMYQYGRGVEIDVDTAEVYFKKSFELFAKYEGCIFSKKENNEFDLKGYLQYRIGKQYERGQGVKVDFKQAQKWYEESNIEYARFALGNIYFYGEGENKNFEKAFLFYRSTEIPFAQLKCAVMTEKGIGVEKNLEQAEKYYIKAFSGFEKAEKHEQNDLFEYQLGCLLYEGKGCEKDIEKSIKYLEMATKKKNIHAQYKLSMIYIEQNIEEKIPKALKMLYELADEGNHALAQYTLGRIYIDGTEGNLDIQKGIRYLEQSAKQGNEYAQYYLGRAYLEGEKIEQDPEKGLKYLKLSAKQGNKYMQYYLGRIYLEGRYVDRDIEKGLNYLRLSEAQGNEYAKKYLEHRARYSGIRREYRNYGNGSIMKVMSKLKQASSNEVQRRISQQRYKELERELRKEHSENIEYD